MPDWKQYEGELAGGFPLERYLGGNEAGAVFLTRLASKNAAIRLVHAGQVRASELVERWNLAATLRHPHLTGIFAAGTCELAGTPVAYVVQEHAEENLAEVLCDRPLTTDETRDMLLPVAEALAYLHGQGLVHGDLKPSNILAVQETVKISSEAVSAGDPAEDIRALGFTLVQTLTQRAATAVAGDRDPVVDELPVPFREIVRHCLQHDSRLRWSAARIVATLRSPAQPVAALPAALPAAAAPVAGNRRSRHYLPAVTAIVAAAAIFGGLVMYRAVRPVPTPAGGPLPAPAAKPPEPAPPQRTDQPKAAPSPKPDRAADPPRGAKVARDEITRRVLPDIPVKARNTIRGRATEVVRVAVDPSGSVMAATLERSVSPYFGRLVLEAARRWQFSPAESAGPRHWILRFQIMRTGTEVTPRKVEPEQSTSPRRGVVRKR